MDLKLLNLVWALPRIVFFAATSIAFIIILQHADLFVDSYAMMMVFSHDESDQVQRMVRLIQNNTLDTGGFIEGFYSYGQVYPTIVFWSNRFISLITAEPSTFQQVAMSMKVVSATFFAGSVLLLNQLLQLLGVDRVIAAGASLVLLVFPDFFNWGTKVHPDTVQMFTLIAPIYLMARVKDVYLAAILAAFVAGVSFGTKYSGVFLAILVGCFVYLNIFFQAKEKRQLTPLINRLIIHSTLPVLSFVIGWLLFNPYVLAHFPKFFDEVTNQVDYLKFGVGQTLDTNSFEWFSIYANQFGIFVSAMLSAGFLTAVCVTVNQYWKSKVPTSSVILLTALIVYFFGALLYLMLTVKYREVRYAYQVFVPFLVLAAFGLEQITRSFLVFSKGFQRGASLSLFLMFLLALTPTFLKNIALVDAVSSDKTANEVIAAGKWLESEYSTDHMVLAGTYSYVPENHFYRTVFSYDVNQAEIDRYRPDLLVMNVSVPGRYIWKNEGSIFKDANFIQSGSWVDKEMMEAYSKFFERLTTNQLPYRLVYEADDVLVFERN